MCFRAIGYYCIGLEDAEGAGGVCCHEQHHLPTGGHRGGVFIIYIYMNSYIHMYVCINIHIYIHI
jgi:hypothetical protein